MIEKKKIFLFKFESFILEFPFKKLSFFLNVTEKKKFKFWIITLLDKVVKKEEFKFPVSFCKKIDVPVKKIPLINRVKRCYFFIILKIVVFKPK